MAEGLYGFRHDIGGIREVLRGDGVQSALRAAASPIAARANGNARERGAEYEAYVDVGRFSALGKVVCGNAAARRDNLRNNTILKSR